MVLRLSSIEVEVVLPEMWLRLPSTDDDWAWSALVWTLVCLETGVVTLLRSEPVRCHCGRAQRRGRELKTGVNRAFHVSTIIAANWPFGWVRHIRSGHASARTGQGRRREPCGGCDAGPYLIRFVRNL